MNNQLFPCGCRVQDEASCHEHTVQPLLALKRELLSALKRTHICYSDEDGTICSDCNLITRAEKTLGNHSRKV